MYLYSIRSVLEVKWILLVKETRKPRLREVRLPERRVLSSHTDPVAARKMPPNSVHARIPIPGTCEYITLPGNRDFAELINLRGLSWEDCSGLFILDYSV